MSDKTGAAIAYVLLAAVIGFGCMVGYMVGYISGEVAGKAAGRAEAAKSHERIAVQSGVGEYRLDPATGQIVFVWKK